MAACDTRQLYRARLWPTRGAMGAAAHICRQSDRDARGAPRDHPLLRHARRPGAAVGKDRAPFPYRQCERAGIVTDDGRPLRFLACVLVGWNTVRVAIPLPPIAGLVDSIQANGPA